MNGCRFSNFSNDASSPNSPEVWEILADPTKRNIWISEYWFEVIKQNPQPYIPVMRIHSGTCPSSRIIEILTYFRGGKSRAKVIVRCKRL